MTKEAIEKWRGLAKTIAVLAGIGLGLFWSAAAVIIMIIELTHLAGLSLVGGECPTHQLGIGRTIGAAAVCGSIGAFFLVGTPAKLGEKFTDMFGSFVGRLFGGGDNK